MSKASFGQGVFRAVGWRVAKLALTKARSRLLGNMTRHSGEWMEFLEHVTTHFRAAVGKEAHGLFLKKFRTKERVTELIRQAVKNPSRAARFSNEPVVIAGQKVFRKSVVIEREFTEVIGSSRGQPTRILRVVVDYTGRPITAFPVAGALAATATVTESATWPVHAVEQAYAEEEIAYRRRFDEVLGKRVGMLEAGIDLALDFATGGLLGSSITGLSSLSDRGEIASAGDVAQRAKRVIHRVESQLGHRVDSATRANIRKDIFSIWGYDVGG